MKKRYLLIATIDVETAGLGLSTREQLENAAATYFGCIFTANLEDDDRVADLVAYQVADDYDVNRVQHTTKRTGPEDTRQRVVRMPDGQYLTSDWGIDDGGSDYPLRGPRENAWIYTSPVAFNDAEEFDGEVIFVEDET